MTDHNIPNGLIHEAYQLFECGHTSEEVKARFEARDLEHAVALMSKHPGVKYGPFEIRPADESINELIAARNKKAGI